MKKQIKKALYVTAFLLVLIPLVISIPPIPTEFYGTVTIYNFNRTPLPAGTPVDIYAGNISCGSFSVVNPGYYGILTCLGDDDYTEQAEGAIFGQNIIFYLNNETAQTFGDTVWYYGEYRMVNITPVPRCGNGWCELTESCITCPEDCGRCPRNVTGNETPPGGGSGGAPGGGSSEGSSGGAGGIGAIGGGTGGLPGSGMAGVGNLSMEICLEDWVCTAWQPDICPVEEIQTRECSDRNNCSTEYLKPATNQSCVYIGTCFDFIRNQDETDIDCGGLICEPCDLGKRCLFDFDCKSGFCHPIAKVCTQPTCTDGFKNQGEEGIDCGGPCPPCERPTLERPGVIARFIVTGCGPFPWAFVLLASIVTILIYIWGKIYIRYKKNSREYKRLRKIEQMLYLYNLNRDLNVFVLLIILLEISISLYWYYLCEIGVWIAIMILIIIPLIASVIIKNYIYDEKRKVKRLRRIVLQHEDYIRKIIKIEQEEVAKLEKELFEKFTKEIDYSKLDKQLAILFKDIRFLIEELLTTKDETPFELLNTLADTISSIDAEPVKSTIDKEEYLKSLYSSLKLVERISRDIVSLYKSLSEDKEVIRLIEEQGKKDEQEEQKETQDEEKNDSKKGDQNKYSLLRKKIYGMKKEDDKINYLKAESLKNQNDPNILFMLASRYHSSGKLDEAEKIYREILNLDEKHKAALYYFASLMNSRKKFRESYELYKKLMEIDESYLNTKNYWEILKKKFDKGG